MHAAAVTLFGIIVPLVLLFEAFIGLWTLGASLAGDPSNRAPQVVLAEASRNLNTTNDYLLFSHLLTETSNRTVVINKQVMKGSVMQIGFALASVGLMFVMLGISDGGGEASMGRGDIKLDLKTSSTGALVLVLGAAMATVGGVMRNDYATVPVPNYEGTVGPSSMAGDGPPDAAARHDMAIQAFQRCAKLRPDRRATCFAADFSAINPEALK